MAKRQQPGCCGCASGTCPCHGCSIPATNLNLTWPAGGSGTLVYGGGSSCTWAMPCSTTWPCGTGSALVTFGCAASPHKYQLNVKCYTGGGCFTLSSDNNYFSDADTCSPFHVHFTVGIESINVDA